MATLLIATLRWSKLVENPPAGVFAFVGLPVMVFGSYFFLGVVGYGVREDGFVGVPRLLAWLIVGVVVSAWVGAMVVFLVLTDGGK